MRTRFRMLSLLLAFLFTFATLLLPANTSFAYHNKWHTPLFSIYVEGKPVLFDVQPFTEQDRLMVPLRPLAEALEASVAFADATQIATVSKGTTKLIFNFKDGSVTKNGTQIDVSPQPRILADRTMVPLRFLSESFGLPVSWDPMTNIVRIGPSQETLDRWKPIREAFVNSRSAMSNLKSFQAKTEYELHAQIPYILSKLDVTGQATVTYHLDPLSVHLQTSPGSLDNLPPELQQQFIKFWNLYIANGTLYWQDTKDSSWKAKELSEREQQDLKQPFTDLLTDEMIDELLPYATLTENSQGQVVTIRYTAEDIHAQEAAESAQRGYSSYRNANDEFMPQTAEFVMTFDKSTHYLTQANVNLQLYERVPYIFKSTVQLSYFNNAPSVELPKETLWIPAAK